VSLKPRCGYAGIFWIKNLNRKFVGYIDLYQWTTVLRHHVAVRMMMIAIRFAALKSRYQSFDFALAHAESGPPI
jgi:hypothetical protein